MSSQHEVSRYRDDSRSHSLDKNHESRSHCKHKDRSKSPSRSKHRSSSREKKHKGTKKKKKSKKKKKKSSSSSSSSSDSDEEELKLLQKLEAERQRLKEEKQKQKELMKANETPEEKRARRLREKQEKERRRRERMGWDGEYQGYTDQDNPFGDSALTDTFVWSKKLAKAGVKNVTRDQIDTMNRQKQMENKIELEKVKQRRLEREAWRAAQEAEAAAAARAREATQYSSWSRHEDAFHLQQARLRSQIRIRDGRAKPIDLLAWYVSCEQSAEALEMHEPYTYLNGLSATDLEDLLADIQVYMELESEEHQSYWELVRTVARDELARLRRREGGGGAGAGAGGEGGAGGRGALHTAVADDVTQVFKGKSQSQLCELRAQIADKIARRQDGVDVPYWETLLSQLEAHIARASLRARHADNLRRKLALLKQEQGLQQQQHHAQPDNQPATSSSDAPPPPSPGRSPSPSPPASSDGEECCAALYSAGGYSPPPLAEDAVPPGTLLLAAGDERDRIDYLRGRLAADRAASQHKIEQESSGGTSGSAPTDLESAARRSMGSGGAQFSVEAALEHNPAWADKYRPRKPRYFNRVHTGFEWNKYNQTHYDMDNPPPKIVQGYKFNIFYPDLVDKTNTPQFSLKPCPEDPQFAVLRFSAGPPYEDIAFRIVNREWEYSYKRGFRCHFHNNIFQLWFHFKRYRYRR